MKHFIAVLVCAFFTTALAAPNVDREKVKQSLHLLKEAAKACNADPATHVDFDALKRAHKAGEHPAEPENLPAHTLCVSKKLEWQKEDGSVNEEVIRSRTTAIFGDNPKLTQILDECVQPQATPEATAKHLFDCYKKHTPRPSGTHATPHH